ncbi:MAG: tripartite tricarboxylate transporter substrate binding protein [Rhizobiales bacterium]|nr:tripartite tricarboxylate transporter substrate binding protein [Hyphomicrobiales bacterium]
MIRLFDRFGALAMGLGVGLGLAVAGVAPAGAADDFPNHSIRFIIPFSAGQSADQVGRIPTEAASKFLPQPIVVEYRPGGQGAVGILEMINSKADGYTMAFCGITCYALPQMMDPAPFKVDDFVPVTTLVSTPVVLVARKDLGLKDVKAVVDSALANPDKLSIGLPGTASGTALTTHMFRAASKAPLHLVPYSDGTYMTDILAGRLDLIVITVGQAIEHVRAGNMVPLAVSGTTRSSLLPDVPTFKEAGFSGVEVTPAVHVVVPKGTPEKEIAILNAAYAKALREPELAEKLRSLAIEPVGDTPQEARKVVDDMIQAYGQVIRDNNIKMGR